MLSAVVGAGAQLAALVLRGQQILRDGPQERAQVRATTGKPLEEALVAAADMLRAVDELLALSGALSVLGGEP